MRAAQEVHGQDVLRAEDVGLPPLGPSGPHAVLAAVRIPGDQLVGHMPGRLTDRGVAESVDETGALLLRQPDGQLKRVLTGDVTLRM